jgi:zinc protease
VITATARPGQGLEKIHQVIDEEIDKLRNAPPEEREMARAMNQIEASFYRSMERVGSFGGKADQLNAYYTRTGMPDFFEEDLARYRSQSAADAQSALNRYLPKDRRVEMIVLPEKP